MSRNVANLRRLLLGNSRVQPIRAFLLRLTFAVYVMAACVSLMGIILCGLLFNFSVVPVAAITIVLVTLVGVAVYALTAKTTEELTEQIHNISNVCGQIYNGNASSRLQIDDEVHLLELRDVYGSVNMLADKTLRDIEEMNRLARVRNEFLANVSHELRTPIFAIQGYLETLIDGALDDENVRTEFVERAFSNTVRLNLLLTDLIDLTRIESGALRFSFRYFPLLPLIEEIVENLEGQASSKEIKLIIDSQCDPQTTVFADHDRLAQVFTNLISNAIKYNVQGGSVTIRFSMKEQQGVQICIEDTGIGISPEHQARIFERFYRVDKGRSRSEGGSGLGLAIVKHILEAHKSSISLSSTPGKGTSISFMLKS